MQHTLAVAVAVVFADVAAATAAIVSAASYWLCICDAFIGAFSMCYLHFTYVIHIRFHGFQTQITFCLR